MTEFAVTMPLLIAFLMGMTDLSRAINGYFILSQISREAARVGSSMEDLELGTYTHIPRAIDELHCDPTSSNVTNSCLNHLILQRRVLQMLSWHALPLTPGQTYIQTQLIGETGGSTENSVEFSINSRFDAIFPIFDGLTISTSVRAPYLYTTSGTPNNYGCPTGSVHVNCRGL